MSTRISESVYNWLINAQFFLLPGICVHCRKPASQHQDLCDACLLELPLVEHPCTVCGLPLPTSNLAASLCGSCMARPPGFCRSVNPFQYQPPVSSLIAGFKYRNKLVNGRVLGEQLASHLAWQYQDSALPSTIIPVPLHKARIRQRGYNQALEIARTLSHCLNIAISRDTVSRARNTTQQTGLTARARKRNLRCAFTINSDIQFEANTTVAIVDDVVTTGVTVSELASVLLKAGASQVHVWAIARSVA